MFALFYVEEIVLINPMGGVPYISNLSIKIIQKR